MQAITEMMPVSQVFIGRSVLIVCFYKFYSVHPIVKAPWVSPNALHNSVLVEKSVQASSLHKHTFVSHSSTNMCTCTCAYTHTHTHTHLHTLSLSISLSLSLSLSLTHTHTHTHTHTYTHTLTHTTHYTQTYTRTHPHTLSHTTHIQVRAFVVHSFGMAASFVQRLRLRHKYLAACFAAKQKQGDWFKY